MRSWSKALKSPLACSPVSIGRWLTMNDKRARGAERRDGWLRGRSSEGQKPMDGCGAKQSHKALVGSNRREGEKP